jgi:fibronectin-binding autotransporter adhesin
VSYITTNQARFFLLGGSNTGQNTLNAQLVNNGTGALTFSKTGAGTWVLANEANSYTGKTSITGTLSVSKMANYGDDSSIGKGTAGTAIGFNNGNLNYTGTGASTDRSIEVNGGTATVLNNGAGALNFTGSTYNSAISTTINRTVAFGGSNGGTISGTIQNNNGAGATINVTKTGSGTWILQGTSSYTSSTAVQEGNLVAGTNSLSATNGAFGNAASDINLGVAGGNGNAGLLIGGAFTVGRNVRLLTNNGTDSGTRVLTIGGNTSDNSEFSGNIFLGTTNNAGRGVTLTAATGGQVTFSGVIQNPTGMDATSYTVTKAGLGTVVLGNTNTYTGNTSINQGTLIATTSGALPGFNSSGKVTVNSGTLGVRVGGAGWSTANVDTLLSNTTKTSGALGIDTSNGDLTQWTAFTTTNLGSALGLTKLGPNKLTLDQNNAYTGPTTIAGGTLVLTGATQATSAITFTGGSLGFDTGSPVNAANAAVDLTNGTITISGATGNHSYPLLTAASITGTPVLAAPVPNYELQVIDGATDELRLVNTGGGSPYETWAVGAPFDGDSNKDGVSNGLAFLLGATGPNANALDKLPAVTQSAGALTLSFSMLNDTANGDATLAIQYGNSLSGGSWTEVPVPYTSGTVGDIVFNVTGTGPLNVTATIPASKAAGGKLFGRVKGVIP